MAPDVYFTAGYGIAEQEGLPGSWVLLEDHDGAWQMPLLMRRTGSVADATSPYGYAGVFADGLSPRDVETAWRSSLSVLRDLRLVSLFLRSSPLVPQAPLPDDAIPVVTGHATRAVRVASPDAMWAELTATCRNKVRAAEKAGLTATVGQATVDDLRPGSSFRSLYESTMSRRDASEAYRFTTEYFLGLLEGLGDSLWLGKVHAAEGETVAASLFLRHGRLLHYHLSGSRSGVRGATNLLLWTVLQRAYDVGLDLLHLGGGLRNGDSLYSFKKSFGGEELTYDASGLILDRQAYAVAVAERAEALLMGPEQLEASTFFPRYRAR